MLPLPSSYQNLKPFLSNEAFGTRTLTLVRVGGRLAHADLQPSAKISILMPVHAKTSFNSIQD